MKDHPEVTTDPDPRGPNPLLSVIEAQGVAILDGGLATALENRGFDLDDPLWSARLLLENPEAISAVHRAYLEAGADCITTSSYQASLAGFERRGLSRKQALHLLRRSTELAVRERDRFSETPPRGRLRPLVAASIGPFGAFLADGSEYTGNPTVTEAEFLAFHEERWRILAESPCDLLACETIPSLREASVLLELLDRTPGRWAWFSFTCRDGASLSDGTPFTKAVTACRDVSGVAAIGVNCTAPEWIPSLIDRAVAATDLPVVVYPNSGEIYDAATRAWRPGDRPGGWSADAVEWHRRGARCIGGCCRVGPDAIRRLRTALRLCGSDETR